MIRVAQIQTAKQLTTLHGFQSLVSIDRRMNVFTRSVEEMFLWFPIRVEKVLFCVKSGSGCTI